MRIQLEDPQWQIVDSDICLHTEGVFLSPIRTNDIKLNAAVSAIMLNDRKALQDLFFDKQAQVEILECNIGSELADGYWLLSFLGKETRPEYPTEYFAFVVIASCGFRSKSVPTVLSLWAPEDKMDSEVREMYVRETVGKENMQCDPYARQFDNLFVFHALSKLRARLDQLPNYIRVVW